MLSYILLNVHFSKKNYKTCKESGKYVLFTVGKRQSIEIIFEEAQIWDLLDKDFKSVTIHMFKELKEIISKGTKKNMRTISHQTENINKEIKIIKRNQIEILELTSTITKIKVSLLGSTAGSNRQKKESENLKIGQMRLFNLKTGREIKETLPFTTATKRIYNT